MGGGGGSKMTWEDYLNKRATLQVQILEKSEIGKSELKVQIVKLDARWEKEEQIARISATKIYLKGIAACYIKSQNNKKAIPSMTDFDDLYNILFGLTEISKTRQTDDITFYNDWSSQQSQIFLRLLRHRLSY